MMGDLSVNLFILCERGDCICQARWSPSHNLHSPSPSHVFPPSSPPPQHSWLVLRVGGGGTIQHCLTVMFPSPSFRLKLPSPLMNFSTNVTPPPRPKGPGIKFSKRLFVLFKFSTGVWSSRFDPWPSKG